MNMDNCEEVRKVIMNEGKIIWGGWSTKATIAVLVRLDYCNDDGLPILRIDGVERVGLIKDDREYILAIAVDNNNNPLMQGYATTTIDTNRGNVYAEFILVTEKRAIPPCKNCGDNDVRNIYEALNMGYCIHVRLDLKNMRIIDMELINRKVAKQYAESWGAL